MKKLISIFVILILVVGLIFSSVYAEYDSNTKVLLHLNTNLTDSIGNVWTNHGASISSGNKFGGGSLYLNGSSYIDSPDSDNFYFGNNNFTIDFWVYRAATGVSPIWRLFGQSDSSGSFGSRSVDSAFYLDRLITAYCNKSTCIQTFSSQTVPGNSWVHIAIVRNGDVFSQYINGILDGSTTQPGFNINNSNYPFSIGRLGSYPIEYMNGYIDEFRVSNVARWTTNFTPPISEYSEDQTHTPTNTPTSTPFGNTGTIPYQYQGQVHLFVLAGQSNMVGVNPAPTGQPTSQTIYNFGNDYRWHIGIESIDSNVNQVDFISSDNAGYGPGMSFALRLQEIRPGYIIGLIPCAKSGTSMFEWQRSLSEDTLYGSCLKRIKAAETMGTLEGYLFYQGENEALFGNNPDWGMKFSELVSNIRSDVVKPNLPVVFVQINNLPDGFLYTSSVQASQANVSIPNVNMISAIGLPKNEDYIHLTIAGEQSLGISLANSMNLLLP
jgi:hypothetical protein